MEDITSDQLQEELAEKKDLRELMPNHLQDLKDFENEIKEELAEDTPFSNKSWAYTIQAVYGEKPEDISAYGRQKKRIIQKLIPAEKIEEMLKIPE